jgi:hypothetical protein
VTPNLPAQTDAAIRGRLLTPRKQLVLGIGNTAWLVSPQQGFTVDSNNGPTPISCDVIKGPGGRSFVVDFSIETHVRECNLETSKYPSIFLSHRWESSHTLDQDFFTSRIIKGHVIFDTARLYQAKNSNGSPIVPDQYRGAFFHPIPPNCQRRIPLVRQHPDGNSVEYVIVDEEQAMNLGPAALLEGVTRIEANHEAALTTAGLAKKLMALGSTLTGGLKHGMEGFRYGAPISGAGAGAGLPGFAVGAIAGAIKNAIDEVGSLLPMEVHHVIVRVYGNGFSIKETLLSVAQGVANDRVNRLLATLLDVTVFTFGSTINWDMKNRVVTVTRSLQHTPVIQSDPNLLGGILGGGVLGIGIDFSPSVYPKFPGKVQDEQVDSQNAGAYILFPDGTTNATPPGDGLSRGTFLENVVAQALSDPCQPQPLPIGPPSMGFQASPPVVYSPLQLQPNTFQPV